MSQLTKHERDLEDAELAFQLSLKHADSHPIASMEFREAAYHFRRASEKEKGASDRRKANYRLNKGRKLVRDWEDVERGIVYTLEVKLDKAELEALLEAFKHTPGSDFREKAKVLLFNSLG